MSEKGCVRGCVNVSVRVNFSVTGSGTVSERMSVCVRVFLCSISTFVIIFNKYMWASVVQLQVQRTSEKLIIFFCRIIFATVE